MNAWIIGGYAAMAAGAAVTALGTTIQSRRKRITWVVGGAVLFVVGGVVNYYGGPVQSRKESARTTQVVEAKIDSAREQIRQAQRTTGDSSAKRAIDSVQNQFTQWADSFLNHREQRRYEFERKLHGTTEDEFAYSAKTRPILDSVISTLKGLASAYTSESGHRIEVHFPPVPENFFDSVYTGFVKFGDTTYLNVGVGAPRPADHAPSVVLQFGLSPKDITSSNIAAAYRDNVAITNDTTLGEYLLIPWPPGSRIERIMGPSSLSRKNFQPQLRSFLERLFEAELHFAGR